MRSTGREDMAVSADWVVPPRLDHLQQEEVQTRPVRSDNSRRHSCVWRE